MDKFDVIVTRHPALVKYLRLRGLVGKRTRVVQHASREDVEGMYVCGVLPMHLAVHTRELTTVELDVPAELRGKELTLEQLELYAKECATYTVMKARPELIPEQVREDARERVEQYPDYRCGYCGGCGVLKTSCGDEVLCPDCLGRGIY
jgi:hypothetical protein